MKTVTLTPMPLPIVAHTAATPVPPQCMETLHDRLMERVVSPTLRNPLYVFPENSAAFRGWLASAKLAFDSSRLLFAVLDDSYTKGIAALLAALHASPWHDGNEQSPIIVQANTVLDAGTEIRTWFNDYNRIVSTGNGMTSLAKRFGSAADLTRVLEEQFPIGDEVIDASEEADRAVVEFVSLDHPHTPAFYAMRSTFESFRTQVERIHVFDASSHTAVLNWDPPPMEQG